MATLEDVFPLEIRLFGPFDVRLHGAPLPPLRSRTGQWLLALLVLRHDREMQRDWLAGTLWPDSNEAQALANLRRTLTDLRQALDDQAANLRSPTPHTLCLHLTKAYADVVAFDVAVTSGTEDMLARAVALYRGPLLEGCTEEWILTEREQRAQAYLAALETLAEAVRLRQDHAQAAHYYRLVIAGDALRETAQRGLIRAQADSGNMAAATQSYRAFRLLLRREMNADPDPETTALYHQLRGAARRHAQMPPVQEPVVRKATIAPTSPRHLPIPLTRFVGREKEIEEIIAHLEQARLVSLSGTGGIGKTRLAIRVAEEMADDFTDGVWFVDLSPLADATLMAQAVASPLQVREQANRPLMETLCEYLARKSLLLVLDNCEHLVEACATLAAALLQSCPRLCILATTRQPLGIGGETVWRVSSLSLPAPESAQQQIEALEVLTRYEAIRLFVDCAVAAMPTFALTAQSAPPTVQICRRLDGIPLALELAAARTKVLSVEQIAHRLDDRLRLLTEGSRTAPRRQQTLRATIDWSHDLLTEPERALLRRLCVFAGGWTLEAVEAIAADPEGEERRNAAGHVLTIPPSALIMRPIAVLDLLTQLVDRSLVVVEGNTEGAARYRLMDSIREYALERLRASGEEEMVRVRHRNYYLALTEEIETDLTGPEQATCLERLEKEHDNLRAVLTWASDAETRVRLTGAIWLFWTVRGYYSEGRAWLRTALTAEGEVSPSLRAKAIGGAAILASEQNDFAVARTYFEEALTIRRQIGDKVGTARALNNLGLSLFHQERYAEAQPLLEESLALKRAANDRRGIALSLGNLGLIARAHGDIERALQLLEECLTLCREIGDRQNTAWAIGNLGDIAYRQGDLNRAHYCFLQSLHLYNELQDRRSIAGSLNRIAMLACQQGAASLGARLLGAAEALCERIGIKLLPAEEVDEREAKAQAIRELGSAKAEALWNAGCAMSIEEAVALALTHRDAKHPDAP